jgi:hypothetical protein
MKFNPEDKRQLDNSKNNYPNFNFNFLDENAILNLLEYDSVISFDDLISKLNINNPQIIIDTLTKLIEDEIILVKTGRQYVVF